LNPYYTPYSLSIYLSLTKRSQPPTQTIRQYWHHTDPITTARHLQLDLDKLEYWLKRWRIGQINQNQHITFTPRRGDCAAVYLNRTVIPQGTTVEYLGINLDRRLTWKPHIHNKRKQLGLLLQRMYWIIGRKSKLSLTNKLLIYKIILKPILTYGIPLEGTAFQTSRYYKDCRTELSEWRPTHHGT